MSSRASLLILTLLAGAAIASPSFAATDASDAVQVAESAPAPSQEAAAEPAKEEAAPQKKAEAPKAKAKKRVKVADAAADAKAKAAKAKKAKAKAAAKKQEEEPDRYTEERDRGLDVASKYAPKTIEKVRKKGYLEKGETANTGGGNKGWRSYVDKYYKGL